MLATRLAAVVLTAALALPLASTPAAARKPHHHIHLRPATYRVLAPQHAPHHRLHVARVGARYDGHARRSIRHG